MDLAKAEVKSGELLPVSVTALTMTGEPAWVADLTPCGLPEGHTLMWRLGMVDFTSSIL